MKALNSMSAPGYRSEVLGSDIVNYIIDGRCFVDLLIDVSQHFFFQSTERQRSFSVVSQMNGLQFNT